MAGIRDEIALFLQKFSAVNVTGARQSGKTTLIKASKDGYVSCPEWLKAGLQSTTINDVLFTGVFFGSKRIVAALTHAHTLSALSVTTTYGLILSNVRENRMRYYSV